MMWGYGSSWPFWEVGLMWIGMIVFWGLVFWAIYALVASATSGSANGQPKSEVRSILDRRLANGEIDIEEYRQRLDVIKQPDQTPVDISSR